MPAGEYQGTITVSAIVNMSPPPSISSVSPSTGLTTGGTTITISGLYFSSGSNNLVLSVALGDYPCTDITVINPTTLTCITSPASPGAQDVVITTISGTATLAAGFTYLTIAQTGDPIQTITAVNCPTTRTRATDARDGNTYWVRKIPGTGAGGTDLCWMETNLAYAGGGSDIYGDTLPPFTQGIGANIASGQACYGDGVSMAANPTARCYWNPVGSNVTSGTTDPSTSTNGTGQYGYLYNWCTAMAGQSAACQTTTATQPDPSVSICPSGWRLPTGEATTGEFTLLNNAINGGSTSSSAGLLTNGLYMNAGAFYNGSSLVQGSGGFYWSSTVASVSSALSLYFYSSNVDLANVRSKGYGFSVRCVAP
ncbi:IPT/TIG domain-containing protein [Candidatus Saccharibacteria bacterium]|nr:IPT/TIG domain-containing protein [Candidatus Saccharibacteria bacterium]